MTISSKNGCEIKVRRINLIDSRTVEGKPTLVAFADVCYGPVQINGVSVSIFQGKRPRAQMPGRASKKGDRSYWNPIVEIRDDDVADEIEKVVLAAYLEAVKPEAAKTADPAA